MNRSEIETERNELLDKLEQLLKTRGGRLLGGWYALNDAWLVAEGNAHAIEEVEKKINASHDALFEIMSDDDSRERVLLHFSRLLHNFLASAVGLDEQTKGHVRRFYRKDSLQNEFFTRHDQALKARPLYAVVKALRDVALHYALPSVRVNFAINVQGGSETAIFHLDVMYAIRLLQLAGKQKEQTHQQALRHLGGSGEELPLTSLTEGFLQMYGPLREWLREREHQVVGAEIDKFESEHNDLVSRYNATLSH